MAVRGRHRRWLTVVAILAGVVLLAGLFASRVVGYVFQGRVAKALAAKTNVRVEFGTVLYAPPYTFYSHDVHVMVPKGNGVEEQRFAAGLMSITFDHFPRPGDPIGFKSLVVRRALIKIGGRPEPVALDRVELSAHETESGVYEGRATVSDSLAGSISGEGRMDVGARQLRLEKISGAVRIAPLLTRLPLPQRSRPAMNVTSPDGKISVAGWATVPLGDIAHADYQIAVDLEDVSVKIPKLKANVEDGSGRMVLRPSGVGPAAVEASIESIRAVSNKGGLELGGGIAVIRPREGTWDLSQVVGTVKLGNELPLFLPNSGWFFNEGQFNGSLRFTLAASGPFKLAGKNPLQEIRHEVLAYPRDFSIRPRNFVFPIDRINGGPIAFRGGVVSFQNLTGIYGNDKLMLRNARLVLDDPSRRMAIEDLRTQVKFEEIAGTVVFDRLSPPYPGVVGKTVWQLQPEGAFVVGAGSWYAINRPPRYDPVVKFKPDFYIRLRGDGGSFAVRPYRVPMTEIEGEAIIAPMSVAIAGFKARTLEGMTWADGQIVPGKPFLYQGKVDAREVNLGELAQLIPVNEAVKQRLTGTAAVSMRLAGTGRGGPKTPAEQLIADGEWEVIHGDFWSVPAVKSVASHVRKTEDLGTADAAGVVHVENNTVTLENAAISSPLLGLQGHGTIGLDKTLNLTVVAAPLGDWRDRMKQTGVPLVGDIMGAVQQLMNAAQGTLLFQYRVTGTMGNPSETVVPAPVITEPVAYLFGQMLRQDENEKLLTDVKQQAPGVAARGETVPAQAQPASAQQRSDK